MWEDKGNYYLSTAPQRSEVWLEQRKDKLTASNFGYAIKDGKFKTMQELALDISGVCKQEFTNEAMIAMNHGTDYEPMARDWYMKNYNVEVEELGLAIPKWDSRIGGSVDGDVINTTGIIEIKCPKTMYYPLIKKMNTPGPTIDYKHIWEGHYCQMQGCMAIMGKEWCDYIVYATESNKIYVERIPFDSNFWNNELYPKIDYFLKNILQPIINKRDNIQN